MDNIWNHNCHNKSYNALYIDCSVQDYSISRMRYCILFPIWPYEKIHPFLHVTTITKSIETTVALAATIIHSCVSILLRLVDRCNASHQQLWCILLSNFQPSMLTSSNGNIFRVTGHLCGEFAGPRWIPHTKASDVELSCFLWSASEQTVE